MDAPPPSPRFALAKIQPPRPRLGEVERPVLEQMLGDALRDCRLVLLLAPAGYGKTVALTRQLRRLPAGWVVGWVSADSEDQLQRFLACLTAALDPIDLPWRVAPEALATLALNGQGLHEVAGEIVNALAAAEVARGLVVIDDAHRIGDPRVFDLLQLMLDRLPDNWCLVLASRVEPPLALARLRVRGDLGEFRQQELRFSVDEVGTLLASSGAAAAPGDADGLLARTNGWAAGLRLSLATRAGSEAGAGRSAAAHRGVTQRHLFDFLAAEVLDDMPPELCSFLLRCSVLPELTALRCAQVSGEPQALRLLEEVERRGLFVSLLDADELTLRLHDLFRDFLQDRLQRDHADELPALLRRAAAHEPDLARAVGYLTRAGSWDEAARRLAAEGPELLGRGGSAGLSQMLGLFPPAEFEARPELHWLSGLTSFARFDFDALVSTMQRASEGFARAGREDAAALAQAYACIGLQSTARLDESAELLAALQQRTLSASTRAVVCFGSAWAAYASARSEAVAGHFAAMLDALEQVDGLQPWDSCFFHSLFIGLPGMGPLQARFAQAAASRVGELPTHLRAGAMHVRAGLALAQGRLDESAQWLAKADDDCRWLGQPRRLMTDSRIAHMLIDALLGRAAPALAAAQAAEDDFAQGCLSNRLAHRADLLFVQCRARWILGDAAGVRAVEAELGRIANRHEWRIAPLYRRCSQAMVALLDARWEAAEALLLPLAGDIDRCGFFPAVQARWMLADLYCSTGRPDAAAATLRPWFDAARRDGEVGSVWLAGPAVLERLASVDWGERLGAADLALLHGMLARLHDAREADRQAIARVAACGRAATGLPAGRPARPADMGPLAADGGLQAAADPLPVVGLTEREREVLARMAAGDSNKLIARAFDLSPHTVKRHVANILGKLGAQTRGQAAARWRESRHP